MAVAYNKTKKYIDDRIVFMVIKIDVNRHGIRRETDTDAAREKSLKRRAWEQKPKTWKKKQKPTT